MTRRRGRRRPLSGAVETENFNNRPRDIERARLKYGRAVMRPAHLAAALTRLRLSQSEAARRLGVQQSTMYRWLAGERTIPGPVEAAVKCWLREVS